MGEYVPRPKSPKTLRIDDALRELCDLQIGRPLSQEDIADYCGITQQFVSKIEKRARKKLRFRLGALGIKPNGKRGYDLRAAMRGL